ncbi:MAG: hypothetical protein FJW94_08695, partial [Actinobacteria bacterium]|nr:hypothetical protein [Actinomycetota bacterium]
MAHGTGRTSRNSGSWNHRNGPGERRDLLAGTGIVLALVVSLAVVAVACLPSGKSRRIGIPTSRRTVASTIVTTTTTPTTAPPTTAPPTTAPPTTAPPTTAPPTLVPSEPPSSQFDACG